MHLSPALLLSLLVQYSISAVYFLTKSDWLYTFSKPITARRGTRVFEPGDRDDYVYFVGEGLLATVWWDETGTR